MMKNNFIKNQDLRDYCRSKNVPFWKVAEELHISEPTMTRKMRSDLSSNEKESIKKIVDHLAEGSGGAK